MGFEDKKMLRQRHKRSKSCTVPEKKKLEDENSIDSSLDASQRLKLDLPRCGDKSFEMKKDLSPDVKFKSSLKQEVCILNLCVASSLSLVQDHLPHSHSWLHSDSRA
jgi:hypothetical protein